MRLIDNPDPYNGGKEEVALLNSLIRRLHEHLKVNDLSAWIVASGVQSEMDVTVQVIDSKRKVHSLLALPVLQSTVLKLREASKGSQGQPWFSFSLVIQNSSKPKVSYDWSDNPRVHDFDLILDLAEFPRPRATLPDWYFA